MNDKKVSYKESFSLNSCFWRNWEWLPPSDLGWEKIKLPVQALLLSISLSLSLSFSSSIFWPWTMTILSAIPDTKLLILDLLSATIKGEYLANWVNISEYSFMLTLPCFKLMNSCTLASSTQREWTYLENLCQTSLTLQDFFHCLN